MLENSGRSITNKRRHDRPNKFKDLKQKFNKTIRDLFKPN